MPIYDAQHHWWPRDYFDMLLDRDVYPKTTREGDGYTYWFSADEPVPFPVEFVDLDVQIEQMAATGYDIKPVSAMGLGFDDLGAEESRDAAQVINDARAKAQSDGKLIGVASIPWRDTDMAAAEIERAVAGLGLRGVTLPANIAGEGVDAPRLQPLYERLAELDATILIHPSKSIVSDNLTDYDNVLDYMLGWMMDTSVAAMRLVLSGIMERNPTLKVLHHHAGATIPYVIGRIDKEVSDPWAKLEKLPELPSHYLKRMYVDVVVLNPPTIRMALDFYGADHVLYGSDYPFWTVEASMNALEAVVTDEERPKVLTENAERLFGVG